jgi:hypothetical protein
VVAVADVLKKAGNDKVVDMLICNLCRAHRWYR